ncbi:MAG: flagellar biosynthesis protein FlhF [Campylobacteraceae bacterium 4484_4]|nr:MAG: flagellar biosynthesis protein FlhF [Campylobacteraceae bacterium 4484_4]
MKLFTFTAETPADALRKAQKACGRDALVISTKQVKKRSLSSSGLYEVVVAIEEKELPKTKSTPRKKVTRNPIDEEILVDISETARQISTIDKLTRQQILRQNEEEKEPKSSKKTNETAMLEPKEVKQIKENLAQLNDKLKLLQEMLWEESAPRREGLVIPPEFAEIYKIAKRSGMDGMHLHTIMEETLSHMPAYMKNSSTTIKRYFQVLLKKMIPVRVESELPKGEKKIIMFVGPTGVGKTTTLAKLAARYSFIKYRLKVGILTLDTYRIGALEQLFQYAKMMKLPIEDVVDTGDFERALGALTYCDIILIDTVGSSPKDREKIRKLSEFVKSTNRTIDVNLVLSASTKLEDLREAFNAFSFLDIDTTIFTKLDETRGYGNIFSLTYEHQKPISYFSTGQEVPDDIMEASSTYLIDCMLEGFSKEQTS